jgi:alpha-glucosidase
MPDDWAPLTVAAQRRDPRSTWSFYRAALRARRRIAHIAAPVEIVGDRSTVLELRRGDLTVLCNCGSRPVRLPAGEVLIASGPLTAGLLPPDTAVWLERGRPDLAVRGQDGRSERRSALAREAARTSRPGESV